MELPTNLLLLLGILFRSSIAQDGDSIQAIQRTLVNGQLEILGYIQEMKREFSEELEKLKEGQKQIINATRNQLMDILELMATDECLEGKHRCDELATCTDQPAGYICTCQPGYTGDGLTCSDLDECEEGSYSCRERTSCVNTIGSYECGCVHPYYGNDCEIYCPSPSLYEDDLGCIILIKENMTWSAAKDKCRWLRLKLLEDVQLKHLEILAEHFGKARAWIGLRDMKWLTTKEELPSSGSIWREGFPDESKPNSRCGGLEVGPQPYLGLFNRRCSSKEFAFCQEESFW